MIGRRIPLNYAPGTLFLASPNDFPLPLEPGDYCGPVMGFTGDVSAVFFLKPNARDADAAESAMRQAKDALAWCPSPPLEQRTVE